MPVGRKPRLVVDNRARSTRLPYVPRGLGEDAAAEWRRVVPILVERRILTEADLGTLENYVVQIGIARECERILQAEGLIVRTRHGETQRHPATNLLKDAVTVSRELACELGLTPVSRSRPAVRDADDEDDLLA
jgi:P27 family predicted phage terminase small subunit